MIGIKMRKIFKILTVPLVAVLVACGGGGGSSGTTNGGSSGGGTGATAAKVVEVGASATSLRSADTDGITISAMVKDAANNAVTGQAVSFVASSGVLRSVASVTGADGRATALLTAGNDRSNRIITVTVKAGSVEGNVVVPVDGTMLSVAGSSSLLLGASTTYAVTLKDSGGNAIAALPITVKSALGNTVTPAQSTTDNAGATSFTYVASRSGDDVITVTGAGVVQTQTVNVSSIDFAFTAPLASAEVTVNESKPVTVRYLENGAGVAGKRVSFATTRGQVVPAIVETDVNGYATTQVKSSSAGPASVSAQLDSTITTLPMSFVAKTPASINLQVSSAAVAPNSSASTTNEVELRASVRDAAGNSVKGVTVNFTAVKDLSGGRIKTGTAVTNANGLATDSFIAGAVSTAANGVEIQAAVAGTGIAATVPLTVSGQSLFINIAANNTIEKLSTTYRKTFSVQVNDANGAPVAGQNVTLSYYPPVYRKGAMELTEITAPNGATLTGGPWRVTSSTECVNEDLDRNGQLSTTEDLNGNGRLTPGLPGLIAPASVTTSSAGSAEFTLEYGQQYAFWVDFDLSAKVVVAGTESSTAFSFPASALIDDLKNPDVTPAGRFSPFGIATECRNPN